MGLIFVLFAFNSPQRLDYHMVVEDSPFDPCCMSLVLFLSTKPVISSLERSFPVTLAAGVLLHCLSCYLWYVLYASSVFLGITSRFVHFCGPSLEPFLAAPVALSLACFLAALGAGFVLGLL